MLLLNEKSILNINDDVEIDNHYLEIERIIDKIIKCEDFPCAVICKYQDEYHKKEKMTSFDCYYSELLSELERFDIKNGVDFLIDENGFINVLIYGQGYTYNNEYHLITMGLKVLPIDKDKDFIDITDILFFDGKPKKSLEQFE